MHVIYLVSCYVFLSFGGHIYPQPFLHALAQGNLGRPHYYSAMGHWCEPLQSHHAAVPSTNPPSPDFVWYILSPLKCNFAPVFILRKKVTLSILGPRT